MLVKGKDMKIEYNYGFELVQEIIKLKWVPEILAAISEGYNGYNEILDSIPFLSNTELNRKLTVLVEKNAVEKCILADNRTSYSILPFGKDLDHIFKHLADLEEKYLRVTSA